MKKTLLMAALVLACTSCFAQKSNVRKVNSYLGAEMPNFEAAREAIGEALVNEETMHQAETWYIAGTIGFKEMEYLTLFGQNDPERRGKAVTESYLYWLKADSIAMIPTLDKKGREVVDLKMRKKIADKMIKYYTQAEFCNYAQYLAGYDDNVATAEACRRHADLPGLAMFADNKKFAEQLVKDTIYYDFLKYAANYYYKAEDYDMAYAQAARLEEFAPYAATAYEYYYDIKKLQGDKEGARKVLEDAIEKFPEEQWFINNQINDLIVAQDTLGAIAFLEKAIARDPSQSQYYHSKATLLSTLHRFDESFEFFEKAIAMDPTNADFYLNYAYAYSDKATFIMNDADSNPTISNAEYAKARKLSDETARMALPYYQKAYELKHERSYGIELRKCYYRLQMTAEYEKLSEELNNL